MSHVVAIGTCVTANQNGVRVRITEGVVWSADDPFVLFRPDLFRPLDDRDHRSTTVVEQATKAPGEVRRGRPRKQVDG
jgi:hypothetical protein